MEELNWQRIVRDINDRLIPTLGLDVWERSLYYFVLSKTKIRGLESSTFSIADLAAAIGGSAFKAREAVRSCDEKGCISIVERSRNGHLIKALLPHDLDLQAEEPERPTVDIEEVDFFHGRNHLGALLRRENNRCFYCMRKVDEDMCQLDHVTPQVNGGDNSYRNIVATCHDCNSLKRDQDGEAFLRSLYRKSLLSSAEFEERLSVLHALRSGHLRPDV